MPYLFLKILLFLLIALLVGVAIGMWMGRRHGTRRIAILEAQVRDLVADLEQCREGRAEWEAEAASASLAGESSAERETDATSASLAGDLSAEEEAEVASASLAGDLSAEREAEVASASLAADLSAEEKAEAASEAMLSDSSAGTPDGDDSSPPAQVAEEPRSLAGQHGILSAAAGQADDLKKLWGIGPRMESFLNDAGITTFAQIAGASVEQLRAVLNASGIQRLVDIANEETWPDQARLAAEGDWKGLKDYQSQLSWKTGGKPA